MIGLRRRSELESKVACMKIDIERLSVRYYELSRKHEELVEALMMKHDKRSISRYIRKGGPEQAP